MTHANLQAFSKGHGTGNDFVLLSDPEGRLDVSAADVARWCNRRTGIGGDGFIRAVRTENVPEVQDLVEADPRAEWFMDYRNADGSVAEMCGNGVRVFVHFLRQAGLAELAEGESMHVATRAGVKAVARVAPAAVDPRAAQAHTGAATRVEPAGPGAGAPGDDATGARVPAGEASVQLGEVAYYAVDLGPWTLPAGSDSVSDSLVTTAGLDVPRPALSVDMGNPHTVVALARDEELEALILSQAPHVEPRPDNGSNVEFVVPADHSDLSGVGEFRMRVVERGVGETMACGTGAAAAAAATRVWGGEAAPSDYIVEMPGGRVRVSFQTGRNGAEHAVLAGPAVIVGSGTAAL
ncbi:diaminopimelate epimerase [Falsarthrobacter nasiphocae]|uniref:Diaminopimelate epimerase n=1 Tax=Falsarthrobacter nasiphocae TaxID=189863 RepID=A0AAE3YI25_9MICC|nr:diaminopimelate epimerase [Falsarthrobacter nasiphocae]MDR6892677.1 diaminopimelate epimerase [Falsarthrobacter nasiphocae]